eukprot:CAMPEP_0175042170 /NCGR_PEP_ID=MMETSP0052_2-20121109/2387_1 /TAXON_ID=51329 ORGANISM="Polytomella parva, Strain SAG 63-3" /NCGR_SAMPLE_ID=MMETSP0052_2 /ASSEMBLY_ACC=CAM_ASM_000194 /LENGTH=427 /DNA_ID=CAMNT_0016304897 /DNA_START=57 /DNA_END=1336 /DNA_ORIENTATION=+
MSFGQGGRRLAPDEVTASPANPLAYHTLRAEDILHGPYRVPGKYLKRINPNSLYQPCESPLIVFINARSGGRTGPDLALRLRRALGTSQVFDIGTFRPNVVLRQLYQNLNEAEASGDKRASWIRNNLRVLVAGGDGTIVWVLATIKNLGLSPEPPVAIMPLGTGNDLSRSLNWGAAFSFDWIQGHKALYTTLNRISTATPDEMDCWALTVDFPSPDLLKDHPHSLCPVLPDSIPSGGGFDGDDWVELTHDIHRGVAVAEDISAGEEEEYSVEDQKLNLFRSDNGNNNNNNDNISNASNNIIRDPKAVLGRTPNASNSVRASNDQTCTATNPTFTVNGEHVSTPGGRSRNMRYMTDPISLNALDAPDMRDDESSDFPDADVAAVPADAILSDSIDNNRSRLKIQDFANQATTLCSISQPLLSSIFPPP